MGQQQSEANQACRTGMRPKRTVGLLLSGCGCRLLRRDLWRRSMTIHIVHHYAALHLHAGAKAFQLRRVRRAVGGWRRRRFCRLAVHLLRGAYSAAFVLPTRCRQEPWLLLAVHKEGNRTESRFPGQRRGL